MPKPNFELLARTLLGKIVTPSDASYPRLRLVNNRAIDRYPTCIVLCANSRDVQLAVRFAADHGLAVSVRSGGHSYAGHGVCDQGMVIDLSLMKRIEIDSAAKRVRIQSGVLSGELENATQLSGMAVPLGTCPWVGVAGYSLGGGESVYSPTLGYACDNIANLKVVTADARSLNVDAREYPDLLWAMRGAGANFGIAAELEFQMHDVGGVLSGNLRYSLRDAKDVLKFINGFAPTIPPELFLGVSILYRAGERILDVKAVWNGEEEKGRRLLAPLRRCRRSIQDSISWKSYIDEQRASYETPDGDYASHRRAGHFRVLSEELVDIIVECAGQDNCETDGINMMHWHGPWATPQPESAFAFRHCGFEFWVHSSWRTDIGRERSHLWVEKLYKMVRPFGSGAVYLNDLEDEGDDRIRAAYGSNYERLAELKWKYDRQNFFAVNQNIRPRAPSNIEKS